MLCVLLRVQHVNQHFLCTRHEYDAVPGLQVFTETESMRQFLGAMKRTGNHEMVSKTDMCVLIMWNISKERIVSVQSQKDKNQFGIPVVGIASPRDRMVLYKGIDRHKYSCEQPYRSGQRPRDFGFCWLGNKQNVKMVLPKDVMRPALVQPVAWRMNGSLWRLVVAAQVGDGSSCPRDRLENFLEGPECLH